MTDTDRPPPLTLDEYQTASARTLIPFDGDPAALACWTLGLVGEAGELADEIKKNLFHAKALRLAHLEEELGDVLFYVAAIATQLDLQLEDVARANVEKLRRRYPDGFSYEACAAAANGAK